MAIQLDKIHETSDIIEAAYEANRAGHEVAFNYFNDLWSYVHVTVAGRNYTVVRDDEQLTETAVFIGHHESDALIEGYVSTLVEA